MSTTEKSSDYAAIMKLPLLLFGGLTLVVGAALLVAPEATLALTNDPTLGRVGLFRLLGGWLIAIGSTCWSVGDAPERQLPVLTISSVGCGLGCAALVYMWVGQEYRGDEVTILSAAGVLGVFAVLFFWGQQKLIAGSKKSDDELRRFAKDYFEKSRKPVPRKSISSRKFA